MVLSAEERRPIENALAESIGREHARRLMDELPADKVATNPFVRREIDDVRGHVDGLGHELRGEIDRLRGEMDRLRGEIRGGLGDVRAEMHSGFRRMTAWVAGAFIGLTTTMVAGFVTLATLYSGS